MYMENATVYRMQALEMAVRFRLEELFLSLMYEIKRDVSSSARTLVTAHIGPGDYTESDKLWVNQYRATQGWNPLWFWKAKPETKRRAWKEHGYSKAWIMVRKIFLAGYGMSVQTPVPYVAKGTRRIYQSTDPDGKTTSHELKPFECTVNGKPQVGVCGGAFPT